MAGVRMQEPTLEDVTSSVCPDERPYKCLPYGRCFDSESYCSPQTRTVEPCFPHNILDHATALHNWCLDQSVSNVSRWPYPSCRHACMVRFGELEHQNSTSDSCDTWVIAVICLSVILAISLTVNFCLCIKGSKRWKKFIQRLKFPKSANNKGETDRLSEHISKDDVHQRPLQAPVEMDSRESDRDTSQPMLQDRNLPLTINCVSPQPSSTNNVIDEQTRYNPPRCSSNISVSSSSTSARVDSGNVSGVSSPLGHIGERESAGDLSQRERQPDLYFHTNPTSPEVGAHSLVTSASLYT